MTMYLDAAKSIHIAMCLFNDDHAAQANLNDALSSVLAGAGQCLRLHAAEKKRIARAEAVEETP